MFFPSIPLDHAFFLLFFLFLFFLLLRDNRFLECIRTMFYSVKRIKRKRKKKRRQLANQLHTMMAYSGTSQASAPGAGQRAAGRVRSRDGPVRRVHPHRRGGHGVRVRVAAGAGGAAAAGEGDRDDGRAGRAVRRRLLPRVRAVLRPAEARPVPGGHAARAPAAARGGQGQEGEADDRHLTGK